MPDYYLDRVLVELFLLLGADANAMDKNGFTPLMFAVWMNHAEVVPLLLQAGADVHTRDKFGYAALDWAKRLGEDAPYERFGDLMDVSNTPGFYGSSHPEKTDNDIQRLVNLLSISE